MWLKKARLTQVCSNWTIAGVAESFDIINYLRRISPVERELILKMPQFLITAKSQI